MSWRFFLIFLLFFFKEPASFLGIIAPRGEELCGDLAVMFTDEFPIKLSCLLAI